jgi:putative ABC transport system permease protein
LRTRTSRPAPPSLRHSAPRVPHGHFNSPLLSLVSGTYPAGPGQVALTSQVAGLYGAHVGGTWQAAGTTWRVTGIVQDPGNLADEFALVAPGQVPHPSQVIMLLGSSPAVQHAISSGTTLPGLPAAATFVFPPGSSVGPPPATIVLVVEVLGLVFIGLLSVAGFSVMAQRRVRALGMLSAVGATERHLRLVMIVNGLAVGVAAAVAGAALGFAAWFAYVPTLQQATGHVVDAANLPWWAFAIGVALAIATSVLASRRPAKTIAQVPVVAALSGRPAPPKPVHRSALPGVIVFAAGLACLAFTGGLAGLGGGGGPGGGHAQEHALLLLAGLVAVIAGIVLLAPLAISVLTAGAGPRLADPGPGPAHRRTDQRRAAARAGLQGDGRDQLRWAGSRRLRRRRHRAGHRDRAQRAGRLRRPDPQ